MTSRASQNTTTLVFLVVTMVLLAGATAVAARSAARYLVNAESTTATVRQLRPDVCDKAACWVADRIAWSDRGRPRLTSVQGGPSVDVRTDPRGDTLLGREFQIRYRPGDPHPVERWEPYWALMIAAAGLIALAFGGHSLRHRLRAARDPAPTGSEAGGAPPRSV